MSDVLMYDGTLIIHKTYHFIQMDQHSPTEMSIDRLSALMERFRVRTHLFHAGALCGVTQFDAKPGRAFLHVLRRGDLLVTHPLGAGAARQVQVSEPSMLFYPRPFEHTFHHAPRDGSDLVCATLDFEGGAQNPLVQALPPVIILATLSVHGLEQTLGLLFSETEQVRCGHRLLADRLFEVLLLQLLRWLLDHPEQAGIPAGLLRGLSHPKLARALTAMHESPGTPWSLEALAEQAGMSRSAFAAAFKAQLGVPPAQYLLQWRLSIAQSMLLSGASVKSTSDALGYANAASLSRAFTQAIKRSPREWLAGQAGHHA